MTALSRFLRTLPPLALAATAAAGMESLDLGGDWNLAREGESGTVEARVPGNVHLDLERAGEIPDPFHRDNAAEMEWVYGTTWIYGRAFEVPAALLDHDAVLLRCEGLDTVAAIEINGEPVAETDNMHRVWEFDVKELLRSGENEIRVTFSPVQPYIEAFVERARDRPNATGTGFANIRKAPYSNGWDFCARYLTCGIYRPISLVGYDTARVADVRVAQDLSDRAARLDVEITADRVGSPRLSAEAVVMFEGEVLSRREARFSGDTAAIPLTVPDPQRWWPVGMGGQPLYEIAVQIRDAVGNSLDTASRCIGLREIELLAETDDRPLRLAVNGREIFAKGANWVPPDVFPARVDQQKIRGIVADAVAANMNMIRVWGGGYYPGDAFYDACDEMGVLVWSDFMFASAAYPGNNPEFQDNVRAELTDQVRRLRHHPSIAVWCGNNEVIKLIENYGLISREQYDRLFHEVIGTRFEELHPAGDYVGGSPEAGDEHNWWIWHVGYDYGHYRRSHGWMTEFGFQSFPHPATVRSYTDESDRDTIFSGINVFHQRNEGGNRKMIDKMESYFRPAKDFESTLWLSQINQAFAMKTGIEHWRTDWPQSSGALAWQLNDCWPGPTWSGIDYYGRWKAAQYLYRRVYAPVMIAGRADAEAGTVRIEIASDLMDESTASIRWRLTDLAGGTVAEGRDEADLAAGTSACEGPLLELGDALDEIGRDNALLWLEISAGGHSHSNVVPFTRPKNLDLERPEIAARITESDDGYEVTLTAEKPALWTWISCPDPDARYSDNFVHLVPGEAVTIRLTPSKRLTLGELRTALEVRSLRDTYTGT